MTSTTRYLLSNTKLVLASGSEFRQKILRDAGIPFVVSVPEFDEKALHHEDPRELARLRATGKALTTAKGQLHSITLGADQTLSLGTRLFDKPRDREEARIHLQALAGQTHHLHSAYTLVYSGSVTQPPIILTERVVDCPMSMRPLTNEMIERYLEANEWQGCVGCYRIEGRGVQLMESLVSSTFAVMGLPLVELLKDLGSHGWDPLSA